MSVPLYIVDAFSERPFSGNPAAVCRLEAWPEDAWLQSVAAEMNLSETAFVVPSGEGFELRWFTPAVEVDLCGHATLASACWCYGSRVKLIRRRLLPSPHAAAYSRRGRAPGASNSTFR